MARHGALPDVQFVETLAEDFDRLDEDESRDALMYLFEGLEALSDGFAVFDAEDRLVFCNESYIPADLAREFHAPGITFREILEKELALGIVDVPEAEREAWLTQRMERHVNPDGVIEQKYSDGRFVQVVERKSRSGGTVATLSDVTALKAKQAEQVQVIERVMQERDKMFLQAHHELRTPLNAVIGFTDTLLLPNASGQLNETQLGYLRFVSEAGRRLLSLVTNGLAIEKIKTNRTSVEHESVDCEEAARQVVGTFFSEYADHVDLSAFQPPEGRVTLRADPSLMQHMLQTLLSVSFWREEGSPHVALTCSRDRNGGLKVVVANDGPVIGAEALEEIFRPAAPDSMYSSAGGVDSFALNLCLVRQIMQIHNGDLSIVTGGSGGTEFVLNFPPTAYWLS